ncbi:MAG: gliding motility-associated C-terminal domain-containing protein [Paludibacter sp.]|nr:gliding motility-associated C-terminal domain-containing protein [Paludibacter sp.]
MFNGTTYSTAGTYFAHLMNAVGCDSTATLNLSLKLPTTSITNAAICQGTSYLFNGTTYSTAGTYTAHLINAVGCDSTATLNLAIKLPSNSVTNAAICQGTSYLFNGTTYSTAGTYFAHLMNAVGCDSTATLNLSLKLPTTSITNAAICQGTSYLFNGTTYSTAGTYTAHLINAVGCDSTATLNLAIKLPSNSVTNAAICQGTSYLFNGTTYSTAGTYTTHLMNAVGCDSTATLNLTIKLPTSSVTNASICQGTSYLFNGTNYNTAGTYTAHLINAAGCDSIATLNLAIKLPTTSITNAAICQGTSYLFNGTSYSTAGTYSVNLINAVGCDSTATLNLSIKLPTSSITNAAICQGTSYLFNGTNYNTAGIYTAHLLNALGCDSTATLNLTIKLPTSSVTNAAICQGTSYLFNGTSYNAAGTYVAHLINSVGCDSTATLDLTIKLPTSSVTNAAICQGTSYLFNGTNYNTAGIYTAHLLNVLGCDSTATLNLSIKLPSSSITNAAICQGTSYLFNGTSYNTAGTYTAHLINAVGCDSTATLNLSIKLPTSSITNAAICQGASYLFNGTSYNAAGTYVAHLINSVGCDSTATLDLTIKLPTSSVTNAAICQGTSYLFNGTSYSTAGTYTAHLINTAGCDSIATLNLAIKLPTTSTTNVAICQGTSYMFNGTSYSTAGTYAAHLINTAGCDSTATLNLAIKLPTTSTTNAAICQGTSYMFNGTSYNTAGTYTAYLINAAGCDSTATFNLTIKQPTSSVTNAAICQGTSYLFNGISYNAAGTYVAHLINAAGCDSTATLNLTIKLPTSSVTNAAICQGTSYLFNGTSYSTAGTYTAHLINTAGCDSTATLNLSIKLPTTSVTNAAICQGTSYLFNGTNYNTAGTYTAHLINAAGCDSIATLNLAIKLPTTSITNAAICQGTSYLFNGTSYSTAGTYSVNLINAVGCDSTATLNLSIKLPTSSITNAAICQGTSYLFNGTNYNTAGIYTAHLLNALGCDSTATLNLTIKIPTSSITNTAICQGTSYLFNGTTYSTAGTYFAHLMNAVGCDSTATLNLSLKLPTTSITNAAICQGTSYLFNGTNYNTAGTYTAHLVNAVGCDSTATLNLSIKLPTTSVTNVAICQGTSYLFNGTNYNSAGTYTAHLVNAVGCDSTATLNLIIKLPTSSITNAAICQGTSYLFNGTNYNSAGTYTAHLVNAVGCDSTATLNLSIKLPTTSTTNAAICQGTSYLFNGISYNTAGTYTANLINAAGCDSTATLNLVIKLPTSYITNAAICQGTSYLFNGTNYNTAGTYIAHLINAVGCDSTATLNLNIKLPTTSITNAAICQGASYLFNGTNYNTAGTYTAHLINAVGCDSIATLNLAIKLPTSSVTNAAICQGTSYLFNGTTYSTAGTYTAHLINAVGCDSTATLNLAIKLPTTSVTNAAICQGTSYLFNGTTYSTAGTYTAHLINAAGCDSTATLNLAIKLPTSSVTNASICQGTSYLFNGTNYSTAGTYTAHLINAAGCDSIATLNLAIKLPITSITNAAICQGTSYLFNGNSYNTAGTYTAHLVNAVGCDSTATLNLTIKLPTSSTTNVAICQGTSYLFNGITYNTAGTYTAHLINAAGCDSIATLNLTIKLPTSSVTNAAICQGTSYLFNGTNYNSAGTYTAHLVNAVGCDSTATLNLTIKRPTSTVTNAAICQGTSYLFNGTSYNTAGTYVTHLINSVGCDSTTSLNLTIKLPTSSTTNAAICQGTSYMFNGTSYSSPGTYTAHLINAAGCDSTATLNLTIKLPTSSVTNIAICQGTNYLFNGTSYNTAGTYIAHLINAAGCDSTATLNLNIKLPTSSITNASICQGVSYLFNRTSYNTAGTYTAHLMNAVGCDSTATLNLSIKLATSSTTNAAICQGTSYLFNGISYNTAGTYVAHLINAVGCDSTATLNLTIKLPTSSVTNAAICQGTSYLFNGTNYNTAGTYTAHLINVVGCDSTATLNLAIKLPTTSVTNASICQGSIYLFNGTNYNTAGTYVAHLTNAVGCDSIATLNLAIKLPTTSVTNAAICQGTSYLFNGTNYNTAGTYTAHLINAVGCDSTATLNLSLKQPTTSITNVAICQGTSYLFNGTSYSTAGNYVAHLVNAVGCDSTATLNLVMKLPTSSITNATICQGSSYLFNGTTYSTAGTYITHLTNAVGCDSTATLNLTFKYPTSSYTKAEISVNERYLFNGTYYTLEGDYSFLLTNAAGCDSTAHLIIRRKYPTFSITKKSICSQELPYRWNGLIFNAAGTQTTRLINVAGFDSVATLELTVNVPTVSRTKITTCPYALPFVWNGKSFNSAGTYIVRLTNSKGCDSIATLVLSVKSPLTSTTSDYICTSLLPYYWNKTLYYKSGTYTAQFTNPSGCDSVATLILTVVSPSSSLTRENINSTELPYVWNKLAITESGTYTSPIHYVNALGCDSIAKLILKVNLSTSAVTNASVCASELPYVWNATPYYSSGKYTKTMTNVFGDDVLVTLNLSVIAASSVSQKVYLFTGDTYTINGHVYDQAGVYTDNLKTVLGCDSTVVTDLSFIKVPNTLTPNEDGFNDVFMKGTHLKIYNRNGILLFEGNDGWDGKYHGNYVSQDTYFYVLYYISEGKTKTKEGYIMVVR